MVQIAENYPPYNDEVGTVFYVSPDGDDRNDGKTLATATRTIQKSIEYAANYKNSNPLARINLEVKSGYYEESAPITVPSNVSILGDDLRTVVVRPTQNTKNENLFLLNNSCYAYGLRLEGCVIDDLEDPRKGFFFAFAPNAYITTSPYVQNCTASHTPPNVFYAPLDFDNANPLVGNGPGGMIVDDSVLDGYSPLKSMIVDAYTQVAFNGIGICVRGRGYAQLVSFFTNFSRIGVYCLDGGHASLLNSNTTFGDYGLRSEGKRQIIIPDTSSVSNTIDADASAIIKNNKNAIIDYMISELDSYATVGDYSDPSSPAVLSTRKDSGILLDCIIDDLLSATASRTSQFIQGLFKGQDTSIDLRFTLSTGVITVFRPDLIDDFLISYTFLESYIINLLVGKTDAITKVGQLFDVIDTTLTSIVKNLNTDYVQEFGSLITSTAHDFSYAGSGVNFLGLPVNQGGIGETNLDSRIVMNDGGRVFHTSGDETGDFFAGNDFIIRQETGTIEGRAFAKSLFALVTPFSLALES